MNKKDVKAPLIYNKDENNQHKRPFSVDINEYPFKSNWYQKGDTSIHYIDEGEGVPIVLTHGNPDWSFLNRNIIKEMSKHSRVIAYDLPGFGFSDTPKDYDFTPQEHSKWIESLMFEHLKLDKFILVVQDWGGPTGLSVAVNHPEAILGLVISNTWAWKAEGGLAEFSMMMRTDEKERLVYEDNFFVKTLMFENINESSKNNKAIREAYENPFMTNESRKGTIVFPQQITLATTWLETLESKLPTLFDKPVEFIFGEKDYTCASQEVIDKWISKFPLGNLQLLPNIGHFTQEDSPESFNFALKRLLKNL